MLSRVPCLLGSLMEDAAIGGELMGSGPCSLSCMKATAGVSQRWEVQCGQRRWLCVLDQPAQRGTGLRAWARAGARAWATWCAVWVGVVRRLSWELAGGAGWQRRTTNECAGPPDLEQAH